MRDDGRHGIVGLGEETIELVSDVLEDGSFGLLGDDKVGTELLRSTTGEPIAISGHVGLNHGLDPPPEKRDLVVPSPGT